MKSERAVLLPSLFEACPHLLPSDIASVSRTLCIGRTFSTASSSHQNQKNEFGG
jgi:hypothetical protein